MFHFSSPWFMLCIFILLYSYKNFRNQPLRKTGKNSSVFNLGFFEFLNKYPSFNHYIPVYNFLAKKLCK